MQSRLSVRMRFDAEPAFALTDRMAEHPPLLLPKSAGETVSTALALTRDHARLLVRAALPFVLADLVLREVASHAFFRAKQVGLSSGNIDVMALLISLFVAIGASVASLSVLQWCGVTAILHTARASGLVVAAPSLVRIGVRLVVAGACVLSCVVGASVPLIGLGALGYALTAGPVAVLSVAVAAVLLIATVATIVLQLAFFQPVIVVEDAPPLQALWRSVALLKSRAEGFLLHPKWRLSVVLLVAFALTLSLQGLIHLPRLWLAPSDGPWWSMSSPPLLHLPLPVGVLLATLEVASNAVSVPFAAVLITVAYIDARVRYEGLPT